MSRTHHTREESRFAVYSVLLEVFKMKKAGIKPVIANLCSKYHCGSLHKSVIAAVDWSKQPNYADAVAALANNSVYKRGCKHGTRKLVKASEVKVSATEQREADALALRINAAPAADIKPDENCLFPEESVIAKAIRICKANGYLVIDGRAI